MVAALKEAFDRDARRLDFERDQIEAERARAEQALRLELRASRANEKSDGFDWWRRRSPSSAGWCPFFSRELLEGGVAARAALGAGWILLLASLGSAFTAQSTVASRIAGRRRSVERAGRFDCGVAYCPASRL